MHNVNNLFSHEIYTPFNNKISVITQENILLLRVAIMRHERLDISWSSALLTYINFNPSMPNQM